MSILISIAKNRRRKWMLKKKTDENFERKVCVGMTVHHVVEDICIHGHRAHAFGQDGMSDVHSTDIPIHDGAKE
jgi:hypothetical protein